MQYNKRIRRALLCVLTLCFLCVSAMLVVVLSSCNPKEPVESAEPVNSVVAIGFVDVDGPKMNAIAMEYNFDMTGSNVSTSTYSADVYHTGDYEYGSDKIGTITAVYVNDKAEVSATGGTGSGNYVIIELFTDYRALTNVAYKYTMAAKVTQKEDITLADGTVIEASDTVYNNNFGNRNAALRMSIPDIDGFTFYTDDAGDYGAAGSAFVATNCFSQIGGTYSDVHLAYALYLPEDYNENGNYAMITVQNPATTEGTHPLVSVLAYRSAAVYASDWAQELVKTAHEGVDGLIVVVPVITARVNDNGGTPAEFEALIYLYDYLIEKYHVDTNYVYGTGQSVGGMNLLETNRNRDNFFAGLLLYEDQWAQNYYIDRIFARDMAYYENTAATASMHYPRTDSYITWDYSLDTDGNKVYEGHDPYNYYYLISDDNIMVVNFEGNALATDAWTELKYLYQDLAGYDLEMLYLPDEYDDDAVNAAINAYVARENSLNINFINYQSGITGYTVRKPDASYAWLLMQSRQDEISREKLDLNKPFELADEQIQTEERLLNHVHVDGTPIYYLTGKAGAGTQFYNSSWLSTSIYSDADPGWLPEGMSWEKGVGAANIVGVTAIGNHAVAIEYDVNMENLVINLKGDRVFNIMSGAYRDDLIVLDPYEFYDANGNQIQCTIQNVYVNDTANTVNGAERESGSGCYVIVEFAENVSAEAVAVIQRTTVRTDTVIASASYQLRGYSYNAD